MLEYIDPWGQFREDLRIAKMVADVANMLGTKKGTRAMNAMDYILDFQGDFSAPEKPPSIETLQNQFLLYARTHNAALAMKEAQLSNLRKLG